MIVNKNINGVIKSFECPTFDEYLNIVEPDWQGNIDEDEKSVFKELYDFIEEFEKNNHQVIEKHTISDPQMAYSTVNLQHFKDILFEGVTSSVETHKLHNSSYQLGKKYLN